MNRDFEINGISNKIQEELIDRVSKNLAQLDKEAVEIATASRPKGLNRVIYLRFQILNQQFSGNMVIGLPFLVKTARLAARLTRKIVKRIRRENEV